MCTRHLSHRGERGAAAVEFALVLLPLLFIVFGIIDYGRLFYIQVNLESATREIARQWAVAGDEVPTNAGIAIARLEVSQWQGASDVSGSGDPVTWSFSPGGMDPAACADVGEALGVTVEMPFSMVLPLLPGPAKLRATTVMRCERAT